MKKKFIFAGVCIVMLLVVILTGCSLFESGSSFTEEEIVAPKLSVMGNVISWGSVKNATLYEVYSNDKLVTTTGDNYYIAEKSSENKQFCIVAIDESLNKRSEESNKVMVYKQNGFSEDETMFVTLESGCYTIPATINYVTISGTSSNAYFTIENRNTDLVIALNNVVLTSSDSEHCISTVDGSYDATAKRYTVIIDVNGVNSLTVGNKTSVPSQAAENSDKKGANGYNGGNALNLANIEITGSGSLTLTGGSGGIGGQGANATSGLHSPGEGGNGGKGGNGIATTKMLLCMESTGSVTAYGGQGGAGGSHGINGNAMTGIWNNLLGTLKNGSAGKEGTSMIGDIKIYGGVYTD